jgi:hypothetical protein
MDPTVNLYAVVPHKPSTVYFMDRQGMPFNPYQILSETADLITCSIRRDTVHVDCVSGMCSTLEAARNTPPQVDIFACKYISEKTRTGAVGGSRKRTRVQLVIPRLNSKAPLPRAMLSYFNANYAYTYLHHVYVLRCQGSRRTCDNITLVTWGRLALGTGPSNDGDKPKPNPPRPEKPKPDKPKPSKEGGKESERVKEPKTKEML